MKDIIDVLSLQIGELSKLAVVFEIQFRLLCENLKLGTYQAQNKDGLEILYAPQLSKLLDKLEAEYPHLKYNFRRVLNLRNAIAHANFFEFSEIVHEGESESLRGNAISLSFKDGKLKDLKDAKSATEIRDVGLFGMLLTSVTEKAIKKCSEILLEAIYIVKELQGLRAFSGEGDYFSKLFKNGSKFTNEELDQFEMEWSYSQLIKEPYRDFLEKYYQLASLKKD